MNGASEQEIQERAMNDPEVREIMQDPIIRNILQQLQQDPSAVQEFVFACVVIYRKVIVIACLKQ